MSATGPKPAVESRASFVWSTLHIRRGDSQRILRRWAIFGLMQTASLFTVRGAGVALLGRLALTVAQNLGIAAERIHDCGRDEFDTG